MNKRKVFSSILTLIIIILALVVLPVNSILLTLAQGQAGTTLSANVTASAINLTEYNWSIVKSANASEIYLSSSNPVTIVEYTVSVTKTTKVSYYIEGYVCVTNGGERATENLAINLDVYIGPPWKTQIINDYPVDVSAKPVLDPGESYCYYYKVDIPSSYWNETMFKVDANVTITNHSGWLRQPYGPRPDATTTRTLKTKGPNCIDVTDTNGFTWFNVCSSSSWTYAKNFAYNPTLGDFYEYNNTATIEQTGQSSSWTVKVYQFTVSANVTASAVFKTIYEWSISKEADASEVRLSRDNPNATVTYTVKVDKNTTQLYYIEGQVCVTNEGGVDKNIVVKLSVYGLPGEVQIIADYPVATVALASGSSQCFNYKVDIPSSYWNETMFKVVADVTVSGNFPMSPYQVSNYTTTSKSSVIYGYDCINVNDTNGYSWCTCESTSWTYNVTFEYDPDKGENYTYINTATILETNQSANWTVTVYQELMVEAYATVSGVVFWDNNYNGAYDNGDKPISGVTVYLYRFDESTGYWILVNETYSDENGYYSFSVETGYSYKIVVSTPVCEFCNKVVNTTRMFYIVDVGEATVYENNDFGFVCLKMLTGAYSKGYWSWSQYNKRTGQWLTRVTDGDVNYINSELGTSFRTRKELADFLVSPVYGNMSMILMQQLIATLLNLKYGYVSGDTVIYHDGMYITINEVVNNAKSALQSGVRCEQEYWKNILDAINNNSIYYVYVVN